MSGVVVLVLRVLLVAVLYGFLGFALWVLWQQLEQTSERIAKRRIPAIRLKMWSENRTSVELTFAQTEVSIGRDPHSDVPLQDEAVSVRQALLSFHHGQWWIQDLGSKNGTRLNSQAVGGATVLMDGDEIQCGQSRFRVALDGAVANEVAPSQGGSNG
jgi:predicted component of type VI protein secretion system